MSVSDDELLNIILISTILLIVLIPFFIIIYNVIYRKKLKKNKEEFEEKYQVYIPEYIIVRKMNYIIPRNSYELRYPFWLYSRKDGTQDKRRVGNRIIRPTSYIFINEYRLESIYTDTVIDCVKMLREKYGNDFIEMNREEKGKYLQIKNMAQINKSIENANELYSRFSSNPFEFETYCANLFRDKGYAVEQTPKTNDGGYDLIIKKDYLRSIVECKCFKPGNSVSRPLIQKLVGANQEVQAYEMIFITTSDFSKEAIEYAKKTKVRLINGIELINMIQCDEQREDDIGNSWYLDREDLKRRMPKDIYI